MGRLRSLLFKELQQHLLAWLSLVVLQGLAVFILLVQAVGSPTGVSLLEAYAAQLMLFVPIAAMILGSRLVVAEYHGRTQLFVESLPMRRSEMAMVKYVLGLLVLSLGCAVALLLAALFASSSEPIDLSFLLLVACRSAGFVFCVWSFFFAMGFTGRLRVPIYLALLLAIGLLDGVTDMELERFGPFALADASTLPFERSLWPWRAFLESVLLGTGWWGLGMGLAVLREGSLVESLSRRMSHREKAIIAVLFTVLLMAFVFYDERRDKEPYAFELEEVVRSETLPIEILYLRPALEDDASDLLSHLEGELQALQEVLEIPLPDLRVAYYASLDGRTFDWAKLRTNDGLLVRANFARQLLDRDALTAEAVTRVIDEMTHHRADFEPRAWVRDGFGIWWATRAKANGPEQICDQHLAQAVRSTSVMASAEDGQTFDLAAVNAWWRLREAQGESAAEAIGASGLRFLEERQGRETVLALVRRLWGSATPRDVRVLWQAESFAELFSEVTGESWPTFVAAWGQHLLQHNLQPALGCNVDGASQVKGTLELAVESGGSRRVTYTVDFAEPPADGTLVRLLHRRLGPFDRPLEPDDLRREEHLWPGGETATFHLDGVYGRGSRVFLALEVEAPDDHGRALRLLAQRRELP